MIFVLMSDSHGRHENIYVLKPGDSLKNQDTLNNITGGVYLPAKADVIIHSGDVSMRGTEFEIENFLQWYSKLPYKYKILISGNHDKLFEKQRGISQELLKKYPDIIYLESQEVVIEGIKIYGEPRQPRFGFDWAFNVDRGNSIKKYWDAIPDDTDILVTHGPPKGILDMTMSGDQVGCEELLYRIWELKNLILCQFGHIHEHAGYEFKNEIHFVNASVLNLRYQLQNKPYVFEIDKNKNIKKIDIMEDIKETVTSKENITFGEFMKIDVRICEITSVEKIEGKDRLYKLEINTGFENRIVVSGVAHQFTKEQLLNKKFPFVLNLPPRVIGGVESNGMILMSEGSDKKLYELGDQNAETGAIVI